MKNELATEVESYVELFQVLREKFDSETVALGVLVEIGKNRRVESMRSLRVEHNSAGDTPLTPRQAKFLKELGIAFNAATTKRQASELIDKSLAQMAR